MQIEIFPLGALMTNAYLIYDEAKRGIIIDPGYDPHPLLKRIREQGVAIEAILLTHAHADHIGGLEQVRAETEAPVYIHESEQDWLQDAKKNGSAAWEGIEELICQPADYLLSGGEELSLIGTTFTVCHTPGHSPGSVSYVCQTNVFSGDALFRGAIGRTDLYQGDAQTLRQSIQEQLFSLPDQTVVLPGHGPRTTIVEEKEMNPYVGRM